MTQDREHIEHDAGSGRWEMHHYGLALTLAERDGQASLLVEDTSSSGRPFRDMSGQVTISVSGRIPIVSFDGRRELEWDRADITGAPLRAGSGELDIAWQEWTYAKAIYAARDLALTSPTFQAALNPPASQDRSGPTPTAGRSSPSELLTQAAERFGSGFALLAEAAAKALAGLF